MNIAIIGYGKMGKAIEETAIQRGHTICLKIHIDNREEFTAQALQGCDVAIEFTGPNSAVENITACFDSNIPVVCGSTGWIERLEEIKGLCLQKEGAFIYASNFSIGVNIFFELNKKLSSLMKNLPSYKAEVEEIHHTEKKDAPSGTAITLAKQIIDNSPSLTLWVNEKTTKENELQVISQRIDPAPGTHKIIYRSDVDDIEITHTAHNRTGFALGAVLAAEFLLGKKGVFSMAEVLEI